MSLLLPSPEVCFSGRRHEVPASRGTCVATDRTIAQKLTTVRPRERNVAMRIHSSLQDVEAARILNLGENAGLIEKFSAVVKPSTAATTKQSKEEEEKRNYYLNTGYAIRTLREEFPALFYRELSFDIYRDDIVFKDPMNTFSGIENYKSIFWALRFHGRLFFRALSIDVMSVWQPVESMIMIRWTVHGIPRVPWESRGRFDGTSEYKLDKNGKIYEHRVHNIAINAPPRFQVLDVGDLIQTIGCSSTPKPTYFEMSSSSILNILLLKSEDAIYNLDSPFIHPQGTEEKRQSIECSTG